MRPTALRNALDTISETFTDFVEFLRFFGFYLHKRLFKGFSRFEFFKGILVDGLVAKRGKYVRPFLHTSMTGLVLMGLALAPLLREALPKNEFEGSRGGGTILGQMSIAEAATTTEISVKPRDSVVSYIVQPGDTVSGIGEKFGISQDAIRWQNDLEDIEEIKPGDKLEIPPVTGVVHKVARGETIYSIAKKYTVDAQGIVNWPFNSFTDDETFALAVGQLLVVPDGVPPKKKPTETTYLAERQTPDAGVVSATGQFVWPTSGGITQYYRWYHPAIDIANKGAPAILAADSGTVAAVNYQRYAYGNHVIIDHGNGFTTLYAHLSQIYVSPGQTVSSGNAIGKMGATGRSTGVHLHFEIRKSGIAQNPLAYLK